MSGSKTPSISEQVALRLDERGYRATPQRTHVYKTLLAKKDHPTAEEVFIRAKKDMPEISMATVYNCLDALVQSKLVKVVHHDRGATRYCSNMQEHHHFYCDHCGAAFDIDTTSPREPLVKMPSGFQTDRFEIVFRGLCPDCIAKT